MTGTDASHRHVRQLREQAHRLEADAERTGDPDERSRLRKKAQQLESDSEQESMMAAGDIYPAE
jgi:transposase-like protein